MRMGWPAWRHPETVSEMISTEAEAICELYVANHLSLNSLRLGFEKVFCFLQLPN